MFWIAPSRGCGPLPVAGSASNLANGLAELSSDTAYAAIFFRETRGFGNTAKPAPSPAIAAKPNVDGSGDGSTVTSAAFNVSTLTSR